MATTQMETVKVKALSKFGFQIESGEYINFSKQLAETEKGKIVPGGEYEVEMYRSDGGKGYVNKVVKTNMAGSNNQVGTVKPLKQAGEAGITATPLVVPEVVTFRTKVITPISTVLGKPLKTEIMSKAEWTAKDRSQLIGGLSHDAAAVVASMVQVASSMDVVEALIVYKQLLEGMLKIREGLK